MRREGTYKVGSNIELKANAPLDARDVVKLKADLTAVGSFPYFYVGMEVFVEEELKKYTLIDEDPTDINSWRVESASSGGGDSTLQAGISVSETVGGLKPGDTFAAGDDIETVLRNMLDPLKYPQLTDPTLVLRSSGSNVLEKGATQNVTLTAAFNPGSISPAYGTSGKRSGDATGYELVGVENSSNSTGTWSDIVVSEANASFTAKATHAAGEQPKNSHGGDYDSPLPASEVTSNAVTFTFVYCMFSNSSDIGVIAKHAPTTTKFTTMLFPPQTTANPETFSIPASWTLSKLEVLNDMSGKFEDVSSEFTVTDETRQDAAGNDVAYKKYTDNRGYNAGSRTIKVTIA